MAKSIGTLLVCAVGVLELLLCGGAGLGQPGKGGELVGGPARQSWSTEDGLPQNSVHAILQAHDGFLWIATEGGLARFDGVGFRVYKQTSEKPTSGKQSSERAVDESTGEHAFASDDVCCLAEDTRYALWIGTADGLIRESAGSFRRLGVNDGLPSATILEMAADKDGSVLVLTALGLARVDGEGKIAALRTPGGDAVLAMSSAADGSVWLATAGELLRYAGGALQREQPLAGESASRPSFLGPAFWGQSSARHFSPIHASAQSSRRQSSSAQAGGIAGLAVVPGQQTVWLRTAREVIVMRRGERRAWRVGGELPGTRIQSLSVDSRGVAWVGTNRGLVSIDLAGADRRGTPNAGSIAGGRRRLSDVEVEAVPVGANSVLSTAEDRDGDRWVGTEAGGLQVLRTQLFRSEPAVADQEIAAVVQTSDGTIWMGTREDGLRRIRSGTARSGTVDRPAVSARLASRVVLALAPGTHGDLWVGTPDGLNHIEGDMEIGKARGKVRTYSSADGLPDDFIRSLLADLDGTVWVGTRRGLVHMDGVSGQVLATYTQREGLRSDLIGTILRQGAAGTTAGSVQTGGAPQGGDGDLWIATFAGLSRLREGRITTFTKADGLAGDVITALAMDASGALWVGTKGDGLTRYERGVFTRFPQAGLPQDIDSILPDAQGRLWMGTRHGVVQVAVEALERCGAQPTCSVAMSRYGYPDGLPSEDLSASGHPAAWTMQGGELWFATRRGVAIGDPAQMLRSPVVPPVAIERLLVDDIEMPLNGGSVRIAPGQTRVTIEYAGLSFRAPSRLRFRYMLEGFDRGWTEAGSRRTAYYTNLPPRRYRFLVQAASSDGAWNEAGAEVRFSVDPAYYRRWWFYLLVLVAAGGLVALLYRLRLRRLKREFHAVLMERNRIAREIHDTLAQDFVGVSVQLEVVAQMLARCDLPAAQGQVDATRTLVREGLDDARRSIWELRAVSANDSLPTRLGRVTQRAGERGLKAECRVGGTYRALPAELEEELLRIAQEAVTNALRHAGASTVAIDLRYSPSRLMLRIVDDGCGFDAAAVSSVEGHFGVKGMRERATTIRARLEIESLRGTGTSVTVDVAI